jgi:hypothetical protein
MKKPVNEGRGLGIGKILTRYDRSCKEKAGVDWRKLALPRPFPGVHLHKVVEEAVPAGRLVRKKPEGEPNVLQGILAIRPTPLGCDGPSTQRKAGSSDARLSFARRAVGPGAIPNQTRLGVRLLDKVPEGRLLKFVE